MPAIIPFIPLIASGVGALGSYFANKKAANSAQDAAQGLSPTQQTAFTGVADSAKSLTGAGSALTQGGMGTVASGLQTAGQGTNYFQTLLSGNRAAMSNAVSQPRAAITDVYRGAERNLDRAGVRGATRDVAQADLGREKAGKISSLITGVQPGAAQNLQGAGMQMAGVGLGQTEQGLGATRSAGSLWSGLFGPSTTQSIFANQQGTAAGDKAGSMTGALIAQLINGIGKSRGGGGGGDSDRWSVM